LRIKIGGDKLMTKRKFFVIAPVVVLSLTILLLMGTTIAAESVKVEGLIKGRSGETIILQTSDSRELIVLLTDSTEVSQIQGMLQVRRKQMAMAALIPGLAIQVEGTYNEQNQLVAKSIKFKGNDLEQAQAIQAGMHETQVQAEQNRQEIEKHNAELLAHKQEIEKHNTELQAQKQAIEAAVARFGQLDDYYILDELTVYFANGKVEVDSKYDPQLLALAEKAKTLNGYMIEVKGYASAVGSADLNQQLSEDRADNVTNILLQFGHIPLTRMLAPGAMGESHQVGNEKTVEGQAENRRVVVRVLQNKAVVGI
jgi:OOP family OmpA-OmpF porin